MLINCSDENLELRVPVWEIGVRTGDKLVCKFSYENGGFSENGSEIVVKYGRISVSLPPKSGKVYTFKFKQE